MYVADQPLAVIADIHGNSWALDAVLADIARRGITQIVNLGDSLHGSLDPGGTAERLIRAAIPSICGNQDHIIYRPSEEVRASQDYQHVFGALTPDQLAWLEAQPKTLALGPIFCCHGTPHDDETYLLEEVTPAGVSLRSDAHIRALLGPIDAPVIVCGHSHVPRTLWLSSGQLIVNPGSVGIPAYDHDQPYPHVMEAGSPHARYALIAQQPQGWAVEQIALPYRWEIPAGVAAERGRPDRAAWIASGRARLSMS
jgi:predicted phosphodiesterase